MSIQKIRNLSTFTRRPWLIRGVATSTLKRREIYPDSVDSGDVILFGYNRLSQVVQIWGERVGPVEPENQSISGDCESAFEFCQAKTLNPLSSRINTSPPQTAKWAQVSCSLTWRWSSSLNSVGFACSNKSSPF